MARMTFITEVSSSVASSAFPRLVQCSGLRQAVRLCGEQLEDVQRPIGRFHGRGPHRAHLPPGRSKDMTQRSAGAAVDASVTGGKSSHSQSMIVTLPLAKFGTSARAAAN